jgi:hypothetical protein
MKLDEGHKQQCECGQETKRDREILGKKKSKKTKHPRHRYQDLELARCVRFQNLERYQNDKKRHTWLNTFQGSVAEEDGRERRTREKHFPNCKAKPVPSWLHPKFQRDYD